MSGIFRDVYLWSPPDLHIRDFEVKTDLDAQYRDAELKLRGQSAKRAARPDRAPAWRRSCLTPGAAKSLRRRFR